MAGVGMTPFGKFLDRSAKSLVAEAAGGAVADAELVGAHRSVQAIYYANSAAGVMQGQHAVRGQHAMREAGLTGIPLVNVENACASGATALHQAWLAVASGYVDVALAVGAEKLHHEDRNRALAAMAGALDQDRLAEIRAELGTDGGSDRSAFMDIYGQLATRYMERSGATREDFARVAVKNHDHGALNPMAQYRMRFTVADVLGGRIVSGPLTVPMCAPIGDGAAAVIVTTPAVAARWGARPVRLLAVAIGAGAPGVAGELVPDTARRAYESAGVGPGDVDVVECHDAAAPAELIVLDELGLAGSGGAVRMLRDGDTALGGRLPVNPSGGLESKGHPVGATGLAQVVELADQLRGRCGERQVADARIGLAENAGGYLGPDAAAAAVTLLGR